MQASPRRPRPCRALRVTDVLDSPGLGVGLAHLQATPAGDLNKHGEQRIMKLHGEILNLFLISLLHCKLRKSNVNTLAQRRSKICAELMRLP